MHRPRPDPQPSPPPHSAFPLQPDPGLPSPSAYALPTASAAVTRTNGTMPASRPPAASRKPGPTSDVSTTADAVSSLALQPDHDPNPSNPPPVRRAKRVLLKPPPDTGSTISDGSTASASTATAASAPPTADTVPLLVKHLDGSTRQVSVRASTTTDELTRMLLDDSGVPHGDGYKLSFGDTDIAPGVALSDTNVISAYTHASSLLQVIGNGRLEPQKTAQALDSVCGVVRSLSNGVTDMDTLCAAAASSIEDATADVFPTDPPRDDAFAAADATSIPWGDSPSPAALVRNLSRQLPTLFAPGASEEFVNNNSFMGDFPMGLSALDDTADMTRFADTAAARDGDNAPPATQPRLTDIAKIRRAKQARSGTASGDALVRTGQFSNLDVPQLDIAATVAAAAASGYGNGQAVVGRSGGTTWMDDIKTTWEAGMMRSSGVLDKTPTGKDVDARLRAFDVEMQADDADMVDGDQAESDLPKQQDAEPAAATAAARAHSAMDVDAQPEQKHEAPAPSAPPSKPPQLPTSDSTQSPSAQSSHSAPAGTPASSVSPSAPVPASAPASSSAAPASVSGGASSSSGASAGGQPVITRKATLIAPSPPPLMGGFAAAGRAAFPVATKPSVPLRRGRRLKNPQLTPEERAQHRKEQKRASARQSRIRKKSMEDDYQQKVRALLGENNQLKIQVADLSHRLECLQGLLTVSLRPVNASSAAAAAAPLFPVRAHPAPQPPAPPFRLQRPPQPAPAPPQFAVPQPQPARRQPFPAPAPQQAQQQQVRQQGGAQRDTAPTQQRHQGNPQGRQPPFAVRQQPPPAGSNAQSQFRR